MVLSNPRRCASLRSQNHILWLLTQLQIVFLAMKNRKEVENAKMSHSFLDLGRMLVFKCNARMQQKHALADKIFVILIFALLARAQF